MRWSSRLSCEQRTQKPFQGVLRHRLEKVLATHSSVLAWKIPWTEEAGGLPSVGSHRVGHDWCDLAAAATCYLLCLLAFWIKSLFLASTPVCKLLGLLSSEQGKLGLGNNHTIIKQWQFDILSFILSFFFFFSPFSCLLSFSFFLWIISNCIVSVL